MRAVLAAAAAAFLLGSGASAQTSPPAVHRVMVQKFVYTDLSGTRDPAANERAADSLTAAVRVSLAQAAGIEIVEHGGQYVVSGMVSVVGGTTRLGVSVTQVTDNQGILRQNLVVPDDDVGHLAEAVVREVTKAVQGA